MNAAFLLVTTWVTGAAPAPVVTATPATSGQTAIRGADDREGAGPGRSPGFGARDRAALGGMWPAGRASTATEPPTTSAPAAIPMASRLLSRPRLRLCPRSRGRPRPARVRGCPVLPPLRPARLARIRGLPKKAGTVLDN